MGGEFRGGAKAVVLQELVSGRLVLWLVRPLPAAAPAGTVHVSSKLGEGEIAWHPID